MLKVFFRSTLAITSAVMLGFIFASVLAGSGIAPGILFLESGTQFGAGNGLDLIPGTSVTISHTFSGGTAHYTVNSTATGATNYIQTFSTATSVTLTHNFGTTSVLTQCYDNASPPNLIIPQNIAITDSNDVTVTFSASQSGSCIVNGGNGSGGGGGGPFTWNSIASGPGYQNGYSDFGSGFQVGQYGIDSEGNVWLRGLLNSGSGATVFTLPVGFRPKAENVTLVTQDNDMSLRIDVDTNGNVFFQSGNEPSTFWSLNSVVFSVN